ncbi:MAG: chorismate lyase [Coxiellaceae bacterium]|nr:chorismate lyase [Coxiellaceae bacterium]
MNKWHHDIKQLSPAPSKNQLVWLTKPYILTEALEQHCDKLDMQLLSMQFDEAYQDEIDRLDQPGPYMIRRVAFYGDDHAWTYARVVIPEVTYLSQQTAFDNLVNKPMGVNMLYNNPDVSRSEFEFSTVSTDYDTSLIPLNNNQAGIVFARRSVFTIKKLPLLISEFFSPQLPLPRFITT